MKKIIFIALVAFSLSGCLSQVNKSFEDVMANFKPLYVDEFCKLKKEDFYTAQSRYSGKQYLYTGDITTVQPSQDATVLGLKTERGTVWAKVDNYAQQPIGTSVNVVGFISPSNFKDINDDKCHILLDNGKLK